MFCQYVLKGIAGISNAAAEEMLKRSGIPCNWMRGAHNLDQAEIQARLNKDDLDWHLNHYDETDPRTGRPFSITTPFISTTAGTVEPDISSGVNYVRHAFHTASQFATDDYTRRGFVFYGYVYSLGRQTIPMRKFAEDVRDLHIYTDYLPYRLEGELVAKIHIPSVRLEYCERYNGPDLWDELSRARPPRPELTIRNDGPGGCFQPPEALANVRDYL